MNFHLRRVSVHVEEPTKGAFRWVLMESDEDGSVFRIHSTSDWPYSRWNEALDGGVRALHALAGDPAIGPRAPGEDEDADPVG